MSSKSYVDPNIIQTRLRGNKASRSPARTRKSSRSPARKSSPPARAVKRSPARKSPIRKPAPSKSPARKSPSRATKEVAEVAPQVVLQPQKSPSKRPALKSEVQIRLENLSSNLEIFRSTRSKRLEYTVSDITSTQSDINNEIADRVNGLESVTKDVHGLRYRKSVEVLPRRSSRLHDFLENVPDIRRSISKSVSESKSTRKSVSKSVDTYSDEDLSADEIQREKSRSVVRRLATPLRSSVSVIPSINWEFGGIVGTAILMLLMPLIVLAIITSCTKSCSLDKLTNLKPYMSLQRWFSLQMFGFVTAQIILQAFFAVVPMFGIKADRLDDKGTKYCFNAFFSSIFSVILLFTLDFYQVINKDILLNEFLRLTTISYILAVILSIVLYDISSNKDDHELNLYGNTGYVLYDFFIGREIHPFIKKLDIKIWISRVSNINTLILLMLICTQGVQLQLDGKEKLTLENYKEFLFKVHLKPTILVYSMMQLTYILNFIMKEHKVTSTFFWNSEGVGYLQTVSSALYPFHFVTISKYLADSDLTLSTNILITASMLYATGFFIMLFSNSIKHEFRSNPLHPSLANVDSMPTIHGKKLLVSGLWGTLRHPNYTGDILIHLALALPGILTQNAIAASPALITVVVLLHRAWRDHARCKRRYGAAWQNYCRRVPYVIIPKVL